MAPSSVALPPWRAAWTERDYNEHVAFDPDSRFVCLDRKGVRDDFHSHWGIEVCDLLGPEDQLIHVKHASGSSPLSHLFAQACVAVQTLQNSPEARRNFAATVARHGRGRTLAEDFVPRKVVYAILLKKGTRVTPDTLFPFAQVALVQAGHLLRGSDVEVEVVGIEQSA
jgi:uncharacterized protein (TIGR04141 family)